MCGICGITNFFNCPVKTDELKAMISPMKHRGPDDEGYYLEGNTGIAMCRLSIIDVEKGHQPISNEDQSIWVVLNGEIYNYIEIRKYLKKKGHVFRTNSDTEVIVHLYEEKGLNALEYLNGMFAFALYDSQLKGLWLVRDRLGIKPLYYVELNKRFMFSSDLNSINTLHRFDIDEGSFLKYLGFAYIPTPNTIYKNVKKLYPAQYLWIKNGNITCNRYWTLPEKQMWNGGNCEAKVKLEELLADSVKLQLRSDVPLGVFLSGGLDSSGIVAFASKAGFNQLNTMTINFKSKNGEDSKFAREVSSQYESIHTEIDFGWDTLVKELDELINFLDEPVSDSAIIPTFLLSKIARDKGIKVILTGAGGDEIFGGYLRHHQSLIGSPRWIAENLPKPVRKTIGNIWSLFQPQRGIRAKDPRIAFGSECSGADLSFIKKIVKKDHYNSILKYIYEPFMNLERVGKKHNYSYERMELDLQNYLVDDVLSLTDKATMAASIEGRVPLLDHRIVEFAFSLPCSLNLADSKPKGLFTQTLSDYLPYNLLNRSKEGFNAPTITWMLESVADVVLEELLSSPTQIVKEIIDLPALEKVLLDTSQRRNAGNTIFGLYFFNRWLRSHLV